MDNVKFESARILITKSFKRYLKDDPIRLAGTTAFFMVIALAPIVITTISVASTMISQSTIEEKVLIEAQNLLGKQGREFVEIVIDTASKKKEKSVLRTIVGIVVFIGFSTTLFSVIQNAINYIWRVRAKPNYKFLKGLKDRALSFGLILSITVILLITLILDAGLAILDDSLSDYFPTAALYLVKGANLIISFAVSTLVFAMVYKFLPDAKIIWKVTWIGALITAALFTLGKFLIGVLLGNSGMGDMYGAAGSIIIVLLWLFYSSIIFYFGAEITQQYAALYSIDIQPKDQAVEIEIKEIRKNA